MKFIVILSIPILILLITHATECWKVDLKRQIGRWKRWQFFMGDGISDLGDPYRGWRHLCRSQSLTLYASSRQTSIPWILQILTFFQLAGLQRLNVEEALNKVNNLILKNYEMIFCQVLGLPTAFWLEFHPPPFEPNWFNCVMVNIWRYL